MKTFFLSMLGGFVALFLFFIILPISFFMIIGASGPRPPESVLLTVDLREDMPDQPSGGTAAIFGGTSFIEVLQDLDAAIHDPAVKGVFVRANDFSMGSSRAEEFRNAIKRLRAADKFVVAHSQGLMSPGPSALRGISAADEVWIQAGTDVFVSGISFETLFMGELLDNISVTPEIEAFYEYKNAPNVYKETDYTEPHREAMTGLATDLWEISLTDIANDRGIDEAALRTLFAEAPLSAENFVANGLGDNLGWPEDAYEHALERAGEGTVAQSIKEYTPTSPDGPLIAIVGGEGAIVTGSPEGSIFGGDAVFASDVVSRAIMTAAKDDRVEAIVFRVDTGGGSATASDQIWNAVAFAQSEGKPVVVSMGRVAASGGYYVSAGADAILASRTTITGSIGVFGGKLAIAEGLQRLGIQPQTITVGNEFASAWNLSTFTDDQRARLRASLERTYDRFITIVADGRNMSPERADQLARGRVWSGVDALDAGLVDEAGGLIEAIEKAKELADIDAGTRVKTAFYPVAPSPFEAIGQLFGASAETARAAAVLGQIVDEGQLGTVLEETRALRRGDTQARMPIILEQ